MTQRKAEKTKSKSGRKKLKLSKDTIRDLAANQDRAKGVRGGAATYRGCVG